VLSTPIINVENLIVPIKMECKQDTDTLRWKPSGQKAHYFQLTATEMAVKLNVAFKDDSPLREAALAQSWWSSLLGSLGYYSMKHQDGTTIYCMSCGSYGFLAQCWRMRSAKNHLY
jgi:hypothetical protein